MFKEYKEELIKTINELKLNDVFTEQDDFYFLFSCFLYVYIRVSTEKQEFGRQLVEIYNWAKKKNVKICIDNVFCDKYTGKTLKRLAYEDLRKHTKENDYILISEISRLGRTWDDTKQEWYKLKAENVNVLVMDFDALSSPLPNEKSELLTVDKKFIQEMIFNGILYASCKKIEEVSKSTKAGQEKARKKGKKIGHPRSEKANKENFIKTLEKMINEGIGQDKACLKTGFPTDTFKRDLKKYYNQFNTKDYKTILKKVKKVD